MKNLLKTVICLVVIIACFSTSYALLAKHHEEHQFDENKIEIRKCFSPSATLGAAIQRKNWDNLPLSDNFRNKYENRKDIISNVNEYTVFGWGSIDMDGKTCILISAEKPDSFFDIYGLNNPRTYFYFEYKVTNDNKLDDINLLKTEVVDAMIGKSVSNE